MFFSKIEDGISATKEAGTSTSIATITEPDCMGPCEPGTNVTLEGIVWQETEGGNCFPFECLVLYQFFCRRSGC